ncbi:MAG: hypothetical protein CMJ18_08590 [Phycisphaeraceae bacterium]|nr:hypothetical protein [Phycisphaeraceae bacterium]
MPLGPVPFPPENPFTEEKRVLGKVLFWEEQLSSDDTVACGTCHRPERGGADPQFGRNPGVDGNIGTPDDVFGSRGVIRSDVNKDYQPSADFGLSRQVTGRRAPDFTGAAYHDNIFWDGRATSEFTDPQTGLVSIASGGALESQAVGPILADTEMAHEGRTWADVTTKLAEATPLKLASNVPPDMANALVANPTYPDLFQDAFGDPAITAERIAFAIATYERTLVPDLTPWDAFNAGNQNALSPPQQQGRNLFMGAGRCNQCHPPPLFSDGTFRNIGLRPINEDAGRQDVTGDPADRGKFKVPSLRNVALRSRFFHNGRQAGLSGAVEVYDNSGGPFNNNRDPVLQGLNFNPNQRELIADFLEALTDPRAELGTFPFDRPTLYTETNPPGSNHFGQATAGTMGVRPRIIALSPPASGAGDFKLGVGSALGGAPGYFAFSTTAPIMGTMFLGVSLHVSGATAVVAPVLMEGMGAPDGHATLQIPIPDDPGLVGMQFWAQWFIVDPNGPAGLSASRGATWTIF